MILVPEAIPVTRPVPLPIVATEGRLLVHVPPGVGSTSVVVPPTHIFVVPTIVAGVAITLNDVVALQPVTGNVYAIVATPGALPVTTPVVPPTVAIVMLLLDHVPAGEVLGSVRLT